MGTKDGGLRRSGIRPRALPRRAARAADGVTDPTDPPGNPTLYADFLPAEVAQVLEEDVLPVAAVRDEPQVRERLLRGADLALLPGQQVREVDQETAVALALVRRQSQYARHVVVEE